MRDFRVVSARTLLRVTSITPIRGFLPPSLIAFGEKLDLTQEIFYNGIAVRDFSVASPSRLIIRIPESQIGKEFEELKVYSSAELTRQDAELSLELMRPAKTVSGMERLVQSWLLIFLTTPGSDVFDPSSGGGARTLIGKTTDRQHKGVAADLALAIERTKTEMLRVQAKTQGIPLSERLLSASLDSLKFDQNTSVLSARVSIRNMLGDQAEVAIR